jgi:hypothetical protein
MEPELERLIAFQRAMGLSDTHLVRLEEGQFFLAHTDFERASGMDLSACPIHQWLNGYGGPPAAPGVYIVGAPEHDGYSVSFRGIPWQLQRIAGLS